MWLLAALVGTLLTFLFVTVAVSSAVSLLFLSLRDCCHRVSLRHAVSYADDGVVSARSRGDRCWCH